MKDIAIYGFGGFGREVACLIAQINAVSPTWRMIGYIDDGHAVGEANAYGAVLGDLKVLNAWPSDLAVVLAIGSGSVLRSLAGQIRNPRITFPNIIAPQVFFFDEKSVRMGVGNIITFGCRLSCNTKLGDFNILNGCVSLGHDACLGNFNVLFPDVRISGECRIGDRNFFGARSFISQRLTIGDETRIGAGSIVLRNTKDGSLYMGNPAKRMEI